MTSMRFVPLSSSVSPTFWSSFSALKLDTLRLDSRPMSALAHLSQENCLKLDFDAFEETENESERVKGVVINTNTLDDFKKMDKSHLLITEANVIWDEMKSLSHNEATINRFLLLMHADLKKYVYYYWFAFPALVSGSDIKHLSVKKIDDSDDHNDVLNKWKDKGRPNFFVYTRVDEQKEASILGVKEAKEKGLKNKELIFGFFDPCNHEEHPGWPLRNFLLLIKLHFNDSDNNRVNIVCARIKGNSLMVVVDLNTVLLPDEDETPKCVGWERNQRGVLGPRVANMRASMDPKQLASSAVDLNLKLMKWRMVPNLNLELVANTKCLILGCGTLGCNVARCLMGWGVRSMTFVDNGRVSFSNPVRQSLFVFDDCLEGGQFKAVAAENMAKRVFPGLKSAHSVLSVPMPGHAISEALRSDVEQCYYQLDQLVKSHDVIFLLMDTREARWLPTVMASKHRKLVINAALGFDSYLVMRHGIRDDSRVNETPASSQLNKSVLSGYELGCYFCNDVVTPGNSTRDRTLDQQCTVTRPGLAFTAASLAVELMASTLQHPLGPSAPCRAYGSSSSGSETMEESGQLGSVPHSIRGFLSDFRQMTPTTARFDLCSACSTNVTHSYDKDGFNFLLRVCNESGYLERVAGLDKLVAEAGDLEDDIDVLSDDDSED